MILPTFTIRSLPTFTIRSFPCRHLQSIRSYGIALELLLHLQHLIPCVRTLLLVRVRYQAKSRVRTS